jgi:hypothetical protein
MPWDQVLLHGVRKADWVVHTMYVTVCYVQHKYNVVIPLFRNMVNQIWPLLMSTSKHSLIVSTHITWLYLSMPICSKCHILHDFIILWKVKATLEAWLSYLLWGSHQVNYLFLFKAKWYYTWCQEYWVSINYFQILPNHRDVYILSSTCRQLLNEISFSHRCPVLVINGDLSPHHKDSVCHFVQFTTVVFGSDWPIIGPIFVLSVDNRNW